MFTKMKLALAFVGCSLAVGGIAAAQGFHGGGKRGEIVQKYDLNKDGNLDLVYSTEEAGVIGVLLGKGERVGIARELLRLGAGRARFTFPALMFALLERTRRLDEKTTRALVEKGRRLGERLEERLCGPEGALLLMPPHPRAAPRHHAPYLRPFDFAFTAGLNVLGIPATVVPAGLNAAGLPLSVQVAAARGGDHLTIAAALALEQDLGGWLPPARLERAAVSPPA